MAVTPNHKPTCRHTSGYLLRNKLKVAMLSPFFDDNRKKKLLTSACCSLSKRNRHLLLWANSTKTPTHAMAAHAWPLAARAAAMHET